MRMDVMNRCEASLFARLHVRRIGFGSTTSLDPRLATPVVGPRRYIEVGQGDAGHFTIPGLYIIMPREFEIDDIKVLVLPPERGCHSFLVGEVPGLALPAYLQVWRRGVTPDEECPPL